MTQDFTYKEFGELIRQHRKRVGLTQAQLGNLLELSRTSITNIERGVHQVSLHQVLQLAKALHVNPETLISFASDGELKARNSEMDSVFESVVGARSPEVMAWFNKVVEAE